MYINGKHMCVCIYITLLFCSQIYEFYITNYIIYLGQEVVASNYGQTRVDEKE